MRSAIATLVLLALLALFFSAGTWQLNRAGEKHNLNAAFSAGSLAAVVPQLVPDSDADEYRFRRFTLHGQYDPGRQILLDSIVEDGRIGYQVLTPFRTGGRTVMVNRGWLQADLDRTVLPVTDVTDEMRTVTARLNRFPVPGVRLAAPPVVAGNWPQRLLFPTRDDIAAVLDEPVADYQLLLEANQPDGYLRDWRAVEIGPDRHYGYAVQWFSFAIMTLLVYGILNVRWNRHYKQNRQTENSDD